MIRMKVSGEIQGETFIGSFYADIEPMKRPKKGVIWLVPNHIQSNHSFIWTMSQQIMKIKKEETIYFHIQFSLTDDERNGQ